MAQPCRLSDNTARLIPVRTIVMIGVLCLPGCSPGISDTGLNSPETPASLPTDTPEPLTDTFEPVTRNADWEPVIETFDGIEMALVPAGCFEMGSSEGFEEESPVHDVCFEEPFWIDVYEVTNGQYGSAAPSCLEYSSDDNQPRVCISWMDALAHCESRGARLPTEAEWEYAARGPDNPVYPWGNDFDADNAVYLGNNPGGTAPVGSKPGGVSWVGAYDLSGSVWEWVSDWYDADYYDDLTDGVINPQGPDSGEYRVLRGGSWLVNAYIVRPTYRARYLPPVEGSGAGFRCAMAYQP